MLKNLLVVILITLSFYGWSQTQGTRVSYPTGVRLLKQLDNCSRPEWRKYETGLEYVEVKATAKQCQQFSNYIIPASEPNDPNTSSKRTWSGKGSKKPAPGAIFQGFHFELINETETFVQIYNGEIPREEIESEVIFEERAAAEIAMFIETFQYIEITIEHQMKTQKT